MVPVVRQDKQTEVSVGNGMAGGGDGTVEDIMEGHFKEMKEERDTSSGNRGSHTSVAAVGRADGKLRETDGS